MVKIRKIFAVIKEFIDLCISISLVIIFSILFCFLKLFLKKSPDDKGDILHLSGASSIGDTLKKFGSLDYLFNYDGKIEVFRKNILLWCPARFSYNLELKDWVIYERKPLLKYFRWSGLIFHSFFIALKHYNHIKMIRAWGPFSQGIAALIISKLFKVPYCVSIHSDYDLRYKLSGAIHSNVLLGSRKLGKKIEKLVLSSSSAVLSQQKMHTNYALSYNVHPEKIKFVYHGIDLEIFKQPPKPELFSGWFDKNQKIISFAGRISSDNYIEDIIEIIKKVLGSRTDVVFFLAGDGAQMTDLKQILKEHIENRKVIVPGFLANNLAKELRKCSTINLCLMGGFSLMEACASGRPVICYDVEWHSELIENNITGFLAKEHNIDKVVAYITLLLDNSDLREKIGLKAKEIVFARHDIIESNKEKNLFYKNLLNDFYSGRWL